MNTNYRLTVQSDVAGYQLAELTLRSEIKILIGRSELQTFKGLDLNTPAFSEMIGQVSEIVTGDLRIPEKYRSNFEIPFTPLTTASGSDITGSTIDKIANAFSGNFTCRIEGSCPDTFLVMGRSTNFVRYAVSDSNLPRILAELNAAKVDPAQAGVIDIIQTIANVVSAGISAYELYRSWQENKRKKEEEEAKKSAEEQNKKELENRRCHENKDSSGGPATDKLMDKIGRTC